MTQSPQAPISWLDELAKQHGIVFSMNGTEPDTKSRYITALYFTFTILTSVGFGNVAPVTNYEKVFTIFAMLLGCESDDVLVCSIFVIFNILLNSVRFVFDCVSPIRNRELVLRQKTTDVAPLNLMSKMLLKSRPKTLFYFSCARSHQRRNLRKRFVHHVASLPWHRRISRDVGQHQRVHKVPLFSQTTG